MGTGTRAAVKGVTVCGKTGTAEGGGSKKPHAWFVGFVEESEHPLAIAVVVENGVWGSRWAAPIASLMMESYIRGGQVTRPELEKRMLEGSLESTYRMYQENTQK